MRLQLKKTKSLKLGSNLRFFSCSLLAGYCRILELEITVTKVDPSSDLGKIHADLKYIADHMRQDDIEGDFEGDWKYAATVFDR